MVRPGRQPLCKPLDSAHLIPDGTLDRHPPVEPSGHPRSRVHVLLQAPRGQALFILGACQDLRRLGSDPGFHPFPDHPLASQVRRLHGPVLRERPRAAVQYRSCIFHGRAARALLLGTIPHDEAQEGVLEHRSALLHDHHHRILHIQHRHYPFLRQDSYQRVPARQCFHTCPLSLA